MLGLRPFTLLGLALLAYLAQPSKKPALKYTALASTHPEGPPFPIWVEIFLKNASQSDSPPGILELQLQPSPTSLSPHTLGAPLPILKPGEKETIFLLTHYRGHAPFEDRKGSFQAILEPDGAPFTVTMTVVLTLENAQPGP